MGEPQRPRLLDLFCGAGGAAMGYHRAGFEIIGIDKEPQPRYPFEFMQGDALEVKTWLVATDRWSTIDAIHASPPCQDYSKALRHMADGYPRLIDPVRDLLKATGLPWVIENVPGAPLPHQDDLFGSHGVELCGSMFGLRIQRHRLFETSFPAGPPRGCDHSLLPMNPFFGANWQQWRAMLNPDVAPERRWREEMGVGWMSQQEGREAIPPRYTEHIGLALLGHLASECAA